MTMPPIQEFLVRLLLSSLFGGLIGLEREIRLKEAGIRTHLIVSLASCMMMLVSKYGFYDVVEHPSISLDASRVAAGIVTAIGFIGAGTIFSRGKNVTGLTTAAGLWATVGIGMTFGAGMYFIGAFCSVFMLSFQAFFHHNLPFLSHPGLPVYIRLTDTPEALDQLYNELVKMNLSDCHYKYESNGDSISVTLEFDHLAIPRDALNLRLQPLIRAPYIQSIHW